MSKRSKNRKKRRRKRVAQTRTETRSAEGFTAVWTTSVIMLAICDVGTALTRLYVAWQPEATRIATLSGLLLFAAVVLGVISFALLPVVLRVRNLAPPPGFVLFAVAVSAAPLIFFVWLRIAG